MRIAPEILRRCWFVAGPTASGKSSAAIELAEPLNAEIVSLDSMALFRGMDIGTAKPDRAMLARVPHHLVDVADPTDDYSVADYLAAADSACRDITSRGKTPLFVGGTGLYLRTVLHGLFLGPPADWELRRKWADVAASQGDAAVHAALQQVDPVTAARLHPRDQRRIIRALEVHAITGRTLSEQQQESALPVESRPKNCFWLNPPRGWLHDRINRRVDEMFAAGLVDEVRLLTTAPGGISRTASQALGYAEVRAMLRGKITGDEARLQTQTHTRQFAKRQCTWFRGLDECKAIDLRGGESAAEIAAILLAVGEGA
jgi:tRNA dimethylallyltransferase